MIGFSGAALRLWFRPREALVRITGDAHPLSAAVVFVLVCAALSGGLVPLLDVNELPAGARTQAALVTGAAVALAPWIYGTLLCLLLQALGSVSVTIAGALRFAAALAGGAPLVLLVRFGAAHIGPGLEMFLGDVAPLLAVIAYSAFAASTVFETKRNPTWLTFGAIGVATFCWGTCESEASRHLPRESGVTSVAQAAPAPIVVPPPVRPKVMPADPQHPGREAPKPPQATWTVRVKSVPPGARVLASGRPAGVTPVFVKVPDDAPSVALKLILGASEKELIATRDQDEVIVVMPPPATLHFDGLYKSAAGAHVEWLSFASTGDVTAAESSPKQSARSILAALAKSKAVKYRLEGTALSFTLKAKHGAKEYSGIVLPDGLKLTVKGGAALEYSFVKP